MKQKINQNQRGFLYKEGDFVRMLGPGKHRVLSLLKETVSVVVPEGRIDANTASLAAFLKDEAFRTQTAGMEIADDQIAVRFVDGRLREALETGSHRFWNVFEQNTFTLLEISQTDAQDVPREFFDYIPAKYYTRIEIADGQSGLLFIDGAFQRMLSSGTHFFWTARRNVFCKKVDMRVQQIDVSGQEMLTADKVGLRMNFLCSYRVTDPVRLDTGLRDAQEQIYSAVQLALREFVGRLRLDALLEQKGEIAAQVLATLRAAQDRLCVEFVDAGLKDIILPGEIRDIMNTVLVAEKKAQANVIARREEVASTRSLLNTAKLLDENATLARLKELETLERIFDKVGIISLSSGDALLNQLQAITGMTGRK